MFSFTHYAQQFKEAVDDRDLALLERMDQVGAFKEVSKGVSITAAICCIASSILNGNPAIPYAIGIGGAVSWFALHQWTSRLEPKALKIALRFQDLQKEQELMLKEDLRPIAREERLTSSSSSSSMPVRKKQMTESR